MPSAAEFQELFTYCTSIWATLNGVNGRLFTSSVNGKTLFFPAAGLYEDAALEYSGLFGYYWSSTYYSTLNADGLNFNNSNVNPQYNGGRRLGFCVRAVKPGTPNRSIVSSTSVSEPKEEETPTTEEPKDDNQR